MEIFSAKYTGMEMASRKIETYQNIKTRICVLFIVCLTWTMNENSLKQNIIVIKEICSWLPLFCKPNRLLFIQPRFSIHVYFAENISILILGSVFSDCVVFYGISFCMEHSVVTMED